MVQILISNHLIQRFFGEMGIGAEQWANAKDVLPFHLLCLRVRNFNYGLFLAPHHLPETQKRGKKLDLQKKGPKQKDDTKEGRKNSVFQS